MLFHVLPPYMLLPKKFYLKIIYELHKKVLIFKWCKKLDVAQQTTAETYHVW